MSKTRWDVDVWQLGAKMARMDAEIGQLWKMVDRLLGVKAPRPPDPNQMLFDGEVFRKSIPDPTKSPRTPGESLSVQRRRERAGLEIGEADIAAPSPPQKKGRNT